MAEADPKGEAVVLVVDDENDNAELLYRALATRSNLRTLMATSATEALAILQSSKVNVLVVDHRMPGMTGAELLQRAKNMGYAATGIMVTAYPEDDAVIQAQQKGLAQCILAKPWKSEDLLLAIDFALGMKKK